MEKILNMKRKHQNPLKYVKWRLTKNHIAYHFNMNVNMIMIKYNLLIVFRMNTVD